MTSDQSKVGKVTSRRLVLANLLAVISVSILAAAFNVYQTSRSFIAVDFSYMADAAAAMAKGVLPYRDFPFAVAPLTFVVQAFLIWLFGPHYSLMVGYTALANALSVVCVWIILRPWRSGSWHLLLLLFALPLLSIYSIYFHPAYDPDTILLILLSLACVSLALQPDQVRGGFLAGGVVAAALSIFAKQNVGPVFLAALLANLTTVWLFGKHKLNRTLFLWYVVAPAVGTVLAVLFLLASTVGLGRYFYWTFAYAASQRLPAFLPSLEIYRDYSVAAAAAIWLILRSPVFVKAQGIISLVRPLLALGLVAFPSLALFAEVGKYTWNDSVRWMFLFWLTSAGLAFAETLVRVGSFLMRLTQRDKECGNAATSPLWLPSLFLVILHSSTLSQGIRGSTYALWPIVLIFWGDSILPHLCKQIRWASISNFGSRLGSWLAVVSRSAVTILLVSQLVVFGQHYSGENVRLDFFHGEFNPNHDEPYPSGPMAGAPFSPFHQESLAFLMRIARWIGNSSTFVPGEDPIFFADPQLIPYPRWYSDGTVNPYDASTVIFKAKQEGREWMVIKGYTQFLWCPACTSFSVMAFTFSSLWIHSPYYSLLNLNSAAQEPLAKISNYTALLRHLAAAYYELLGSRTKVIETPPPRYSGFAEWDLLRSYFGRGYRLVIDYSARYPFSSGNLFAASSYENLGFSTLVDQGVVLTPISSGENAEIGLELFLPRPAAIGEGLPEDRHLSIFIDGDNCGIPWTRLAADSGSISFNAMTEVSSEALSCGLGATSRVLISLPVSQNIGASKEVLTLRFTDSDWWRCRGGLPWIRAIGVWVDQ